MAHQIIELSCPGCGARVQTNQQLCDYCQGPVIISTFNSVDTMSMPDINQYAKAYRQALASNPENQELNGSVAMCYLKLGLYDQAIPAFEKAVADNFDNSENYFYAAVSLLRGKKAFLTPRPAIDKIESYLNAAIMIEPRGSYYYFLAYIKYDYYARKNYRTTPTYQEALQMAQNNGVSVYDKEQLFTILGVQRPEVL